MLSFFRRGLSSWIVLGFLGIVLGAIVVTGVGTPGSLGDLSGGANGEKLASVGNRAIGSLDVNQRLQLQLENLRQQQPGLTAGALVSQGAVDDIVAALLESRAIELFGQDQGMAISRRMVDGQLAGIDAFKGPTGQFDRSRFEAMLNDRNMTEKQLRDDLQRDMLSNLIKVATTAGAAPATGMIAPYAALQLEQRKGSIALIPSAAMAAGAAPTPKELQDFYTRQKQRYTVPELRTVRYATFDRARFEGKVVPTDAEITAQYNKDAAKYGAKESRALTQIIVPDQAGANAVAAKAKAGGDMNAVAKSAGVEALTLAAQDKQGYAALSSVSVADAVYKAGQGAIVGPVKSGLGWHIVRVDQVTKSAGTSLAAARAGIVAELSKSKVDQALADFVAELEDEIADGKTMDEVAKANALTVTTTPEITAGGVAPGTPGFQPPAFFGPVLKDAFQAEPDDDAVVLTIGENQFALVDLDRVIPSAAQPLAKISDQVTKDFVLDRAARQAKTIADTIAAQVNSGKALVAAIDIMRNGQGASPPLALMFSLSAGRAKVLEAPDNQGWFVVNLESITPGQAAPELLQPVRAAMQQFTADEYITQFASAIKAKYKVSTDQAAIARLKKSLSGTGGQ
jgi:peptidyl-prolyl cis-trans isomerase D